MVGAVLLAITPAVSEFVVFFGTMIFFLISNIYLRRKLIVAFGSPDEVRFLMSFNRDVVRRRREELHSLGVRVRWAGREPRLWRSRVYSLRLAQ